MKWLYRWINLIWIRYCVQVSSKAKCPACGIRASHQVLWSATNQAVCHQCKRCSAQWAEAPVLKASEWAPPADRTRRQSPFDAPAPEANPGGASRVPIVVDNSKRAS